MTLYSNRGWGASRPAQLLHLACMIRHQQSIAVWRTCAEVQHPAAGASQGYHAIGIACITHQNNEGAQTCPHATGMQKTPRRSAGWLDSRSHAELLACSALLACVDENAQVGRVLVDAAVQRQHAIQLVVH